MELSPVEHVLAKKRHVIGRPEIPLRERGHPGIHLDRENPRSSTRQVPGQGSGTGPHLEHPVLVRDSRIGDDRTEQPRIVEEVLTAPLSRSEPSLTQATQDSRGALWLLVLFRHPRCFQPAAPPNRPPSAERPSDPPTLRKTRPPASDTVTQKPEAVLAPMTVSPLRRTTTRRFSRRPVRVFTAVGSTGLLNEKE